MREESQFRARLFPFHLATVAMGVVETLRLIVEKKGVPLRVEDLGDLPPIQADKRRMFNVFCNVINNALSEVASGGLITIRGECVTDVGMVCISVIDTGPGMPSEIRDRLFRTRS